MTVAELCEYGTDPSPLNYRGNRCIIDNCRRFCSVVRVCRERTGDLAEEMSGLKPTFYLL